MNIPRKTPGSKKGSVNSQVTDMILAILNTLKDKPENKNKDDFEILKNFLDHYSIDGNHGLLEEIGDINFDKIKDDGFDIDQIIGDDRNTSSGTLHNILNNPSLGTIGKDIEKVVINELIKKARAKVPPELQVNFDKELNNIKSLNEFKNKIWDFFEFGGKVTNTKIDQNLQNEIIKIKITNKDIVDGLVSDGKLGTNDIAGDYKNRNVTYKKNFDKLITQEYLGGYRDSLSFVEKNLDTIKDTFTNFVPNMGWITDKYPYDKNKIDPEILKKIDDAQEKGNKEESDELSFYAYIQLVQNKNESLGDILSKLFQNKFDFSKLNIKEQNEFLKETADGRLLELKTQGIAGLLDVDQNKFDEFMRGIFDLNKKEIIIKTAGGDIRLGVDKKFKGGENPDFADIDNFAESKLPMEFDIKILDENKDLINNTALKQVFAREISDDGKSISLDGSSVGKLILMYTLGNTSFDKKDMNPDKAIKLKKLLDLVDAKKDLNKVDGKINNKAETIGANVEKKKDKQALLDARERFKNEDEPKNKSWINFLHYLKEQEGQKVDDYFGYKGTDMEVDGDNLIVKGDDKIEDTHEEDQEEDGNGNQESVEKPEDPFLTTWKNIKGYNFAEDTEKFGFRKGTRLRAKWGDTELPPLDVGGDQRIQFEIKNITDNNFTVKLTGGELSAGSMEGKEFTYPKTKEFLEDFINTKEFNGEIYKLPEAKDRNDTIGNIKGVGITGIDGISVFDELELKGGKLKSSIIEGNPEITHFGSMETKIDDASGTEKKEIINYEVSFNNNGTVDVKYSNYRRNMDYNNFLLFISTKGLKPKTKDEVDEENKKNEEGPTHSGSKLKFFGLSSILNMVKGVGKKMNEGIKKFGEKQDKKFYNIAVGEWRIANKLNSVIGWIPGVGDALENMDVDYQNNKDKEIWDKTDEILKKIEGHNDYGAIFDDKNYLNEILGSGVCLKDMVLSGKLPGGLSGDKRFVASAVLLAQISKGPGPYHKLGNKRFEGIRVKLLLGEPYYSKFMTDQKEIISEMKAKQGLYGPGYDSQLASDLARAEMTFLINNIGGRAPGQRLGCIETGEFKGLENNAKKLWSDKFSGELETRFNEYISRSKVEEGAGKLENVNNFTFAYGEYRRFLESGRPTKALPYLKKMAQLAKSPDQIKRFKGAIVYGMLSGFFLHYTLPATQAWVQNICRSFGFAPGLWAPHIDHQKKMAHFLNVASKGTFYNSTGYKLSDFDYISELEYKKFREKFEPRWDGNSDKIDEFLKEDMYKEDMNDPTINQLKSSSMEAQQEDIDQDISKNSALIKNYPLSLTKGTIDLISRFEDGRFSGKDNDEVQRSQDARGAIAKAIPSGQLERGRFVYNTKRFLNRFDGDGFDYKGKEEFLKKLATVKKYKRLTSGGSFQQRLEDGTPIGNIKQSDVKNLMRYIINGKIFSNRRSSPPEEYKRAIDAFQTMFWDNLDQIDENFITQTFGSEYGKFFDEKKSYKLAPWSHYWRLTKRNSNEITNESEKELRQAYKSRQDGGFINYDLESMENDLRRKGGSPSLSELEVEEQAFRYMK